jgi:hypothetical protein
MGRCTTPPAADHTRPAVFTIFPAAEVTVDSRRKAHLSWRRPPPSTNARNREYAAPHGEMNAMGPTPHYIITARRDAACCAKSRT